jgi:hypothetical protein
MARSLAYFGGFFCGIAFSSFSIIGFISASFRSAAFLTSPLVIPGFIMPPFIGSSIFIGFCAAGGSSFAGSAAIACEPQAAAEANIIGIIHRFMIFS